MANAFDELKSGLSGIRASWDTGYEIGREGASRLFNNNSYDARNPWLDSYSTPTPQPTVNNVSNQTKEKVQNIDGSGNLTSNQAGGGGTDYSSQLAQLSAQENLLRQFLDSDANIAQQQGLSQLNNEANRTKSDLNFQRGRAIEDFNTKTNQTTAAKDNALSRVGENARTLRNSVMQQISRGAGTGSSAYQLAAPNAVDRQASLDRTDVLDDFGSNFMALDTAKRRAEEDYTRAGSDIDSQLNSRKGSFLRDIENQRLDADRGLQDIARQRAAYQGKNPAAIMAAGATFDAGINNRKAAINGLFDKYNTAYNVTPVQVQNPNLRDYVVDRTAINAGNAAGTPADSTSPYAQFLKQNQDDEEKKLF